MTAEVTSAANTDMAATINSPSAATKPPRLETPSISDRMFRRSGRAPVLAASQRRSVDDGTERIARGTHRRGSRRGSPGKASNAWIADVVDVPERDHDGSARFAAR